MNEDIEGKLEKELYLFNKGKHFDSYLTMGCKQETYEGKVGFRFTVWAPNAKSVGLVGDFADWHVGIKMDKIGKTGCWTIFSEQAIDGQCYKYRIEQPDGTVKLKIDPYALEFEVRPKDASIVKDLPKKKWSDGLWTANKKRFPVYEQIGRAHV